MHSVYDKSFCGKPPGGKVVVGTDLLTWFSFMLRSCVLVSHVLLFVTPWITACQAPLSMGFSRQGYWSGFPFPSPGDLPKPGIEPGSPVLQADSLPSEPPGKPVFSKIHKFFSLNSVLLKVYLTSFKCMGF